MAKTAAKDIRSVRSGKAEKYSRFFKPMLATPHDIPFDDDRWVFEIKWDGYRAIGETGKSVRLYSRNGLSFEKLYNPVVDALARIKTPAIVDGEIVVLNEHHKPDFQALQQFGERRGPTILYYVFDCVSVNGTSIIHLPLLERKRILEELIPKNDPVIKLSEHFVGIGKQVFQNAVSMDLEGVIAKRAASAYTPGKRSTDWLKIKHHNTQQAIIAGYTAPRGSRSCFGALLLAIMELGKLRYIGHTGTGFNEKTLQSVYRSLQPLRRQTSPFQQKVPLNAAVTWVEPKLVCNIKFTEITQEGILRHPVFQGLRVDKTAKETTSLDAPIEKKTTVRKRKNVA